MPHISPLTLADPTFHMPGQIDLLLGCDVLPDIMLHEHVTGPKDAPMAVKTVFGWAILGKYLPESIKQTVHVVTQPDSVHSDELLARFCQVEEPPSNQPVLTLEDEAVQQHYASTHEYQSPGHYKVSLPKVTDHAALGLSRPQALNSYLSNERSIQRKGTYTAFQEVVKDYLDLGHVEPVPSKDLTSSKTHYYLPMHGVTKSSSSTTKLRVVFDASAKTTNGLSLNDILLTGPTLYPSLKAILIRFKSPQNCSQRRCEQNVPCSTPRA